MREAVLKHTLIVIGMIAVVLAILGVFLPLLPTTPFLLLASACFARGSQRLHSWLLSNKLFGTALRDFEQGRGIPVRAKVTALALLWVSIGYSMFQAKSLLLLCLLGAICAGVSIYLVFFLPTKRRA